MSETKKVYERLGMSAERGEFLEDKCKNSYEMACKEYKNNDAIDVIDKVRVYTQNAQEDIFVCFYIGVLQGENLALANSIRAAEIIGAFFGK